MIGLLVATEVEAAPLLERLAARRLADTPFLTYGFAGSGKSSAGILVISGMGRQAATAATGYLIISRGATRVINVGICGSLKPEIHPGEVRAVAAVSDGDQILAAVPSATRRCDSDAWAHLPLARLATVEQPVYEEARRLRLAQQADLVDMEGVAVAEVCAQQGVRCCLLKGVSDRADGNGKQDIQQHIHTVSATLADAVTEGLKRVQTPDGQAVPNLLRFTKVEHTLFSLPLLFAGAFLGAGRKLPPGRVLGLMVVAGLGARALGMAMNRVFDRRLDALNPRTAGRELPSGKMSQGTALAVAATGLGLYLFACWMLGPMCWRLAPVPAIPLIGYSLLKRFTSLCHFGIGLCLALAPLGAFVAASGGTAFDAPVLLLALFTFCWMSGFDIIYAMQDLHSDRETGVHSIPVALGLTGAQAVAAGTHLVAVAAIIALWRAMDGGVLAGAALAVSVGAFVAGYLPQIPLPVRFFPVSAIASISGAMVPLLRGFL